MLILASLDCVQVREELEGFLKDDDDISKMCLTRKLELSKDGGPGGHAITAADASRTIEQTLCAGRERFISYRKGR